MRKISAFIFFILFLSYSYAEDIKTINIGVLHYLEREYILKIWQPIADYLTIHCKGYRFNILPLTHDEMEKHIDLRKIDFVVVNPSFYIQLKHEKNIMTPISTIISRYNDSPVYAEGGVIITRYDRIDINNLKDLKGKTIGIPKMNAGLYAYYAQLYELKKVGVEVSSLKFKEISTKQLEIVEAVIKGDVDAGFIRAGILERFQHRVDVSKLKIINIRSLKAYPFALSTDLYPGWVVSALSYTDDYLKNRVMSLLLSMSHNDEFLKKTDIYMFDVPNNYLLVEEIMKAMRVRPFDTPFKIELKDVWYNYKLQIYGFLFLGTVIVVLVFYLASYSRKIKRLHVEADKNREILNAALKGSNAGYWILDIKTGHITIDEKIAEMFGYRLEELVSVTYDVWEQHTHPEDFKKAFDELNRFIKGETDHFAVEFRLRHKNGEWRWVSDYGSVLERDSTGNPNKIVGIIIDVTEKHKLMEHINKTSKLQSLGYLAGGIAHDFNNILQGIFGYVELGIIYSSEDKVKHFLEKTKIAIERGKNLASQLLTFSKGGAPMCKINALHPWLEETIKFHLSGSNVAAHFDIPKDLHNVYVDLEQLGRVFDNLTLNTKQAMPDGGNIYVKCENVVLPPNNPYKLKDGRYVKITFADDGPGIPKENLSKIFDPFFTTKELGSGLGLSICYSIIEKHGGAIDVDSEVGVGTKFYIYLPIAEGEKATSGDHSQFTKVPKKLKVLVMDDEEFILDFYVNMLSKIGLDVTTTKSGEEALSIYLEALEKNERFDIIISDLTVPGKMGGVELASKIRRVDQNVPIIAVSGYADSYLMERCRDFGFNDSLPKPFTLVQIKELILKHAKSS
ncbi:MAG: PhnD/SsuA/transferrin family substrate-binding protein [Calditerrivibrio sp.]|nr:PhnD/SsuA/transferrin family substrate-binding protein [Calditerrivibrio sp.]